MRYKIVPPARDVAFLHAVSDALPRVPNSVEDCCTRIRDRTDVPSRDRAREYLTFCQALGLAAEVDGAFYRPQERQDDEALAEHFIETVFGAREVIDAVNDDGPRTADDCFETAVEPLVPRWERNQAGDWEATWRERTARLCEWAVVFGLAEAVDGGGFRAIEGRKFLHEE